MSAGQFNTIDPKGAPEQALVNNAFPSFNFDTVDGVTYELDLTQPAKYDTRGALNTATAVVNPSRVKNLMFNGKPIDDKAQFVVATNNYRAYGGGNFPALSADKVILDAPEENREALVEYLQAVSKTGSKVNPSADNNWRILPVPGITMTFSSAATAAKFLPNHKNIKLLKDGADGFATFALVP